MLLLLFIHFCQFNNLITNSLVDDQDEEEEDEDDDDDVQIVVSQDDDEEGEEEEEGEILDESESDGKVEYEDDDDEEEEEEEQERPQVEFEDESSDSSLSEKEVRGPKGSVIKVVQHKPKLASTVTTVWSRLNHSKNEKEKSPERFVSFIANFLISFSDLSVFQFDMLFLM